MKKSLVALLVGVVVGYRGLSILTHGFYIVTILGLIGYILR